MTFAIIVDGECRVRLGKVSDSRGPGTGVLSHGAVEQTETETAAGGGKLERWATLHCSPALN